MRAVAVVVLVLGASGLVACEDAGERTPQVAPTSLAQRVVAARARMHARYQAASSIQLAIGLGDLARARAEARTIATAAEPDFLPEWQPYLADIRASAEQVARARDPITAARTMAQLGRACARCHEATRARVTFAAVSPPPPASALASQMPGHEWAAARMWEGLIGPSDERWLAGARALAASRLTLTAESGELGIADDATRAKLLAARALKPQSGSDRAALYGDLLATCAHCHATIRDRALPGKEQAIR